MLKVLYLGYVWPEPNSSAAGGRTLEFLRSFRAQGWQVMFASAAALSPHRFDLATLDIEEKSIAVNDDGFDQLLLELQPQVVVFDRFFTEEQFAWRVEKHCPQALRVLDTCDLHSLRDARHCILKSQLQTHGATWRPPILAEVIQHMRVSELAMREIAAIFRCDLSLMISDVEMEILQQHFAVPPSILQLNRAMLTANAQQNLPGFEQRQGFLSIGNFRHAPNWDAVLWLKQNIWPAIRARLPNAQLRIFGAYPPPKASQLHQAKEGFHVLGWAEDAQAEMAKARVCLAPLRFGAGIKGKLADAMAAGTPSVTTQIGAEAMDMGLPWCGAVADGVEQFAQVAVELYLDEARWQAAQIQGQQILHRLFNREHDQTMLIQSIRECLETVERHRAQNFIGAMLRHHTMKSTQYMSQWIALKNQQ